MRDGERDEGKEEWEEEWEKEGGGLVEVYMYICLTDVYKYVSESVGWEEGIGLSKSDGSREQCRGL